MKLYSILLFIVFLNLVMGFTFTMIGSGEFLPEAQGVLKNPASSNFMNSIDQFNNSVTTLGHEFNIINLINGAWNFLKMVAELFFSIVKTPAELISQIIAVPDMLTNIITMGMTILTSMTLIQLVTGRWFSFVE